MKRKSKDIKWKRLRRKNLKNIFESLNLPWNRLEVKVEGGVILDFEYPLTPKFFLKSAKEDLKEGGARGLINALSNAKRAIDCQTDCFLSAIGYAPKNLDKQLGKDVIQSLNAFISNVEQPLKFRVLESLGIVTPAIVTRVRSIRNLLEHQYKKPLRRAVRDAIDIAALYISACEGAMGSFLEGVYFGTGEIKHPLINEMDFERRMRIDLESDSDPIHINVHYVDFKIYEQIDLKFLPSDPCYLALLRVLFAVRSRESMEQAIVFAAKSSGFVLNGTKVQVKSVGYG